jgi:hypothetical protein
MILLREEPDQKVEACTFEPYEVYAIDVAMTTGEGKPREMGTRTTVYKRMVDRKYGLKVRKLFVLCASSSEEPNWPHSVFALSFFFLFFYFF